MDKTKEYAKEFTASTAPQRSEQWFKERAGIPSASKLADLFDTKRDGSPSAKKKAYLQELAYERAFKTTYETVQTAAMRQGVEMEDFARRLYAENNQVEEAHSYISPWFVATPDGLVGKHGLLECKVVGDATYMSILTDGVPLEHELQMQGQLLATGRSWVDYIVVSLKTGTYTVKRVKRKPRLIERIYDRLHEPLELPTIDTSNVKKFNVAQPEIPDYGDSLPF